MDTNDKIQEDKCDLCNLPNDLLFCNGCPRSCCRECLIECQGCGGFYCEYCIGFGDLFSICELCGEGKHLCGNDECNVGVRFDNDRHICLFCADGY